MADAAPINVCMVGTGEYTTGYVHGEASASDKSKGVVALTMFDLKRQGIVGNLSLCGTRGSKFPGIRNHLERAIRDGYPASGYDVSVATFPADDAADPAAYEAAFDALRPGDAVTIYTPDDTHFTIALAAIERGLHVLLTKPLVKTLDEHYKLFEAARRKGVLLVCEVHKRWDPMYTDARDRIRSELGDFSYLTSYMSQPKRQLHTFRAWAGRGSDISYYLNSHHVDFHEWCVGDSARPEVVTAAGAKGVAQREIGVDTEDTIALTATWRTLATGSSGVATYTASWVAAPCDVHSQQRFFYMGQAGEVNVDQARRGYYAATDAHGYKSCNPLFMKYTAKDGRFVGQTGYGYKAIAEFVSAVSDIQAGRRTPEDFDHELATVASTFMTTAILEAGRMSLDNGGRAVRVLYDDEQALRPTGIELL